MKQLYDPHTPLTLGTPKNPGFLQKSDSYLIIWSWSYVNKIQFSISFSSGEGGIKSVKLARIYIIVIVEGPRTTPGNQSRAI